MRELSRLSGVNYDTVNKCLRGDVENPRGDTMARLARALGVSEVWLRHGIGEPAVVIHSSSFPEKAVAGMIDAKLSSKSLDRRREEYEAADDLIPVIGEVQAGAWREAFELPESEWSEMRLPADPMYPGVPRYALRNVGESMNRECAHGGLWVFVKFADLTGVGPQPGDYVIVRRVRHDGMIEATCKRLEIRAGKPWLCPDSTDPSFEAFPIEGDGEVEEIVVFGLVTDIVNKPGRRTTRA